jgi:threonine/homoserine/homoserine lactone efflux protein
MTKLEPRLGLALLALSVSGAAAVLSAGGMIEVAWYTAVSFALSSGPMRAGYRNVRRKVDRVLGTLLIAVGLKVAFDAR